MNKFLFHFQTYSPKDLEVLRKAGFDSQEISSICQLRNKYQAQVQGQPTPAQKHLLFMRWLVQQGKLNEGM